MSFRKIYDRIRALALLENKTSYFIVLAVVSTSDGESQSQKTVMFLNRGDSFGDVAILNGSVRETTVISREKIELLVMGDSVRILFAFLERCF